MAEPPKDNRLFVFMHNNNALRGPFPLKGINNFLEQNGFPAENVYQLLPAHTADVTVKKVKKVIV